MGRLKPTELERTWVLLWTIASSDIGSDKALTNALVLTERLNFRIVAKQEVIPVLSCLPVTH